MCDCMAIASKSSVAGDYTVEICYGSEQEVTDYIAALLKDRLWNINIFVEGFTLDAQATVFVLLRYLT